MDALLILNTMAEDPDVALDVLGYLNAGMWDEWDTSLSHGLEIFGGVELQIAAKAGACKLSWDRDERIRNS